MLASRRVVACTGGNEAKRCRCNICRELRDCRIDESSGRREITSCMERTNFILRRAMPFVKRTPSREWQEATRLDDYENASTLEDDTPRPKQKQQQQQQQQQQRTIPPKVTDVSTDPENPLVNRGSASENFRELPKSQPAPRSRSTSSPGGNWRETKIERDANNKVVIYFGEANSQLCDSRNDPRGGGSPSSSACRRQFVALNGTKKSPGFVGDRGSMDHREDVARENSVALEATGMRQFVALNGTKKSPGFVGDRGSMDHREDVARESSVALEATGMPQQQQQQQQQPSSPRRVTVGPLSSPRNERKSSASRWSLNRNHEDSEKRIVGGDELSTASRDAVAEDERSDVADRSLCCSRSGCEEDHPLDHHPDHLDHEEEPDSRLVSGGESNNGDAVREIVVKVSPCREDVLRIEEDDSMLEDYWSLPGDTTGFRADWSFVQQWRLRGPSGSGGREQLYCSPYGKDTADAADKTGVHNMVHMVAERDTDSVAPTPTPHHPHHSQHHHLSLHELRVLQRRPVIECTGNSSSDENRSSGHASMSDTGGHTSGSSPPHRHHKLHSPQQLNAVPEDDRLSASVTQRNGRNRTGQSRNRHRATPAKLQVPWSGSGLEDIKLAIQQLTMRSHTSTSTYSSLSGSESSEPAVRRLMRHSSLETINTNVTSADEFVWVDSHNRLVELQQLPWTHHDVLRVLQNGRTREHMDQVSMETIPRLSYLLQRALVRIGRETQRLSKPLGLCSKHEVYSAFKIVLCPALADSCTKACLRAAAMFAVSGDQLRQSKASRSGLQLPVGRFLRWMSDVKLGRMVHEYAAVYLAAGIENLLEEILLQCVPSEPHTTLTATMLEHAIANSGDLWGLLQPYAHLNAGRIASGALAMPRWASVSSLSSASSSRSGREPPGSTLEPSLLTTCVGSMPELLDLVSKVAQSGRCPVPLTTKALNALFYYMRCSQLEHGERGSGIQELAYERAYVVLPPLVEWLRVATAHAEHRHSLSVDHDDIGQAARLLLPGVDCPVRAIAFEDVPMCSRRTDDSEYVRRLTLDMAFKMLTSGRAELVSQALPLLPAATRINTVNDSGFTALMLSCVNGSEIAVTTLLDAGADVNAESPSPLTTSQAAAGTPSKVPMTGGGSPGSRIPGVGSAPTTTTTTPGGNGAIGGSPGSATAASGAQTGFNAETQHWTALTYTALLGHCNIARILLERGAAVEGGAKASEDKCTVTPLQAATASGNNEMVALLLAHGAQPFLSTLIKDTFCYSGSAQRGCYSAISVATAHGQRGCLHQLLSHPLNFSAKRGEKEVLSLEEILAEGNAGTSQQQQQQQQQQQPQQQQQQQQQQQSPEGRGARKEGKEPVFSKTQSKALQEAMYHSAESNHLDITMELRGLRVGWTLHCWMHSLSIAHEMRIDSVIDQLLQDFLQVCPDDYSTQFVQECLPLLFNIFRYSKKEGTTLLLADIFCTCFGWEPIKPIRDTTLSSGSRIDPKFVNNPELSDVQFRVEGRVFYGHKIVLVTSSPRFRNMLSSKLCEGNPPIVQINDIRYHIFQMVMEFLYHGGCATLKVNQSDVLELMAAANFFQLDGLLRFCEAQCSAMVDLDNIVSTYIHAKVYNAAQLLEYCQGFLLQNMVALLTYDDSVKRLLFAKKLPNHDVLAGLLLTLQARIKARRPQPLSKLKT